MPFFLIIPVWLVVLALAGGLAFIKATRRLALYIAVCSTSGLIVSIIVSTLLLILTAKLPWSDRFAMLGAGVMIGSYLGAIMAGGVLGAALGFWALWRFTRKRARPSEPEEPYIRGAFWLR
jgi:hypothetical protein